MPKNSFQDVVPKRSVRNIPIMRKPRGESTLPPPPPPPVSSQKSSFEPPMKPPKKTGSFSPKLFITLAIVAIGAFVVIMMTAFTSAQVTITPKTETVAFNNVVRMSTVSSTTAQMFSYEVVEFHSEQEKEVPANGEEDAAEKASVKITIYNNFSKEPQRLIARTRFQSAEGLMFRIADSLVVPGKTADGKPGTIEAVIYADEAGEKYNIDPGEFTIPGFKDDVERFKAFYGRSTVKAQGGFVGKVKKVNETDKATARIELQNALKETIQKQITAELDPSLVILNGGIVYNFTEAPLKPGNGDKAIFKETVSAQGVALKKSELSTLIGNQFLKGWESIPSSISRFNEISMTFTDTGWTPNKGGTPEVKISGNAPFVATVDKAHVADLLAGKNKSEFTTLMSSIPAIVNAQVSLKPIWKSTFPETSSKINVSLTP